MHLSFSPRCPNCLFYTFCFFSTSSDCYFCLMCLEVKVRINCEFVNLWVGSNIQCQKFVHPVESYFYNLFIFLIHRHLFLYVTRVNRGAILDSKTQIKEKKFCKKKFWGAKANIEKIRFSSWEFLHSIDDQSSTRRDTTSIGVRKCCSLV